MEEYINQFAATSIRIHKIIEAGEVSPKQVEEIGAEMEQLDNLRFTEEVEYSEICAAFDYIDLDRIWIDFSSLQPDGYGGRFSGSLRRLSAS